MWRRSGMNTLDNKYRWLHAVWEKAWIFTAIIFNDRTSTNLHQENGKTASLNTSQIIKNVPRRSQGSNACTQADNGLACRKHTKTGTQQQELWQVALIPLLKWITPDSYYFSVECIYLYIYNDSWDHTSESLFIFLIFTITYNPDGLYSNSISPIDGNHINTKTKSHHAPA